MPDRGNEEGRQAAARVAASEIEAAIGRIAASGVLGTSSRLEALLRYVVQEELAGRGDRIKAYGVATEVLGRAESFDPSVDSIVRVEFRRLRQALAHYYATAGSGETTVINIPVGSYRPEFTHVDRGKQAPATVPAPPRQQREWYAAGVLLLIVAIASTAWVATHGFRIFPAPTGAGEEKLHVAVVPVESSSHDPALADEAAGLQKQLLVALTRFNFLSVLDASNAGTTEPIDTFKLKVRLERGPSTVRMTAELINPFGIHDWAQSYDAPVEQQAFIQDILTTRLLADLRPRIFIGARRFYDRMKADPAPTSVWASFIRATWVSGNQVTSLRWEEERIALAQQALQAKPDFGPAHSLLAQKLSYLFAVDPPHDTPIQRQQAAFHANRAMDLAAHDPDSVFNVGLYYWNVGRVEDSLVALRRTIELDPNHALAKALIAPIEYFCKQVPPDEIAKIAKLDAELSPDNPFRWVVHSYLGDAHADNNNWLEAERIARESRQMLVSPDTFLRLMLALQKNGKSTEAEVILAHQRENWPHLDLRHYARVTYTDRCGASPHTQERIRLFSELAALAEKS
jgi:tetratricopeptide (TPR) repeat protein